MGTDPYESLLSEVLKGMPAGPKGIHKRLGLELEEVGLELPSDELGDLILSLEEGAEARIQFHVKLAGWDAAEASAWTRGTEPRTKERRALVLKLLGFDESDAARINEVFPPVVDRSAFIAAPDWNPWYDEERRNASHFYWDGYRSLLERKLPAESVASLDSVTTRIVGRLADPSSGERYQSKGLVVGHVQSGKTANFTGVIAKAIDAGYRLIIVLTGTIELLRAQTQRRLDMELIGMENILGGIDPDDADLIKKVDYAGDGDIDWTEGRFVSYGDAFTRAGVPAIKRLTRAKGDYKYLRAGLDALDPRTGRELVNPAKPMWHPDNLPHTDVRIAVVKKNKAVLTKLVDDLRAIRADLNEIPTLIIDDEADQASINTVNPARAKPDKTRTAINRLIGELLGRLGRAQYVGYTATPFANVFVSPEDSEDVFPRDFIVSLSAPDAYRGGSAYHDFEQLSDEERKDPAVSNEAAFLRDLVADDETEPEKVDEEILRALDSYVLAGAIKLWRQEEDPHFSPSFRHHTMLVHESVKQSEHNALASRIRGIWKKAGYGGPLSVKRLRSLYENDFGVVNRARDWGVGRRMPADFDELIDFIGRALDLILDSGPEAAVVVINGNTEEEYRQVDFQTGKVWKILVGGAKLSRGYTLEGLTVSYFKRRTDLGDTLMQMGRWFGYRNGYEDLIRLFMARDLSGPKEGQRFDLYEAFTALMRDEAEFREQLEIFSRTDEEGRPEVRPIDVPPLVFQQLPWLKPTSRTKMFNAELVLQGIGGSLRDYPRLPERGDGSINREHFGLVRPWWDAGRFGALESFEYNDSVRRARGRFDGRVAIIGAEEMLDVLRGFEWTENFDFRPDLEMLVQATAEGKLEDWAVLVPELSNTVFREVDGIRVPVIKRTRRTGTRGGFSGSSFRQREAVERIAGSAGDTRTGTVADGYRTGRRGAMLLTFAADPVPGSDRSPRALPQNVGSEDVATIFSLALPLDAAPRGRIAFRVKRREFPSDPVVNI